MTPDLERLNALLAAGTARPWELWTSNSHRRITGPDRVDGGVLSGCVYQGAGDFTGRNRDNDLALIVDAVNALPELIASHERMRIALEEIRSWALNHAPGSASPFSPATAVALATICERALEPDR